MVPKVKQHQRPLEVVFEDLQLEPLLGTRQRPTPIPVLWPHQVFAMADECARLFTREALDIFQRNLNASFSLLSRLAGAKTFAEILELQASHLKTQRTAFVSQTEEMTNLSIRAARDLLRGLEGCEGSGDCLELEQIPSSSL
jgi:phasin protein